MEMKTLKELKIDLLYFSENLNKYKEKKPSVEKLLKRQYILPIS